MDILITILGYIFGLPILMVDGILAIIWIINLILCILVSIGIGIALLASLIIWLLNK